ncbi:MAG: 16S rRNA (cytidine(1402)-2'-O)-methyltransferase [Gammaproteobacteria bacterium]|nr:16S rRNA (cytidine(1402)-2'-O)-methyltransferase [Gammaproteobacteria bacterium]
MRLPRTRTQLCSASPQRSPTLATILTDSQPARLAVTVDKGVLYVVATPIGNLTDISQRSIDVLAQVDLIAAEDTRHTMPLLRHLGVVTPLLAMHEHNEKALLERLIERLTAGQTMALVSDAGTPLISDPGYPLVRECQRRGIRVSPVPGACALIAALSVSGLATDRFRFEGFPLRTSSARQQQFRELVTESGTLVFYESSHRIRATLVDMARVFGAERHAVIARELTKLHETVISAQLGALSQIVESDANQQKGEFVLLVAGYRRNPDEVSPEALRVLDLLREELPLKQAAVLAARITGEKRNRLYQLALQRNQV